MVALVEQSSPRELGDDEEDRGRTIGKERSYWTCCKKCKNKANNLLHSVFAETIPIYHAAGPKFTRCCCYHWTLLFFLALVHTLDHPFSSLPYPLTERPSFTCTTRSQSVGQIIAPRYNIKWRDDEVLEACSSRSYGVSSSTGEKEKETHPPPI